MARVGTIDDDIGITKAVVLVRGLRQPLTLTGALINTAFIDHFVVAIVVDDIRHTEILADRTLNRVSQKDHPGVTGDVDVTVATHLTRSSLRGGVGCGGCCCGGGGGGWGWGCPQDIVTVFDTQVACFRTELDVLIIGVVL